MDHSSSTFEWAEELKCPKTICTKQVRNNLSKASSQFVWDHMSTVIHPTKTTSDAKKNILLYLLKSSLKNKVDDLRIIKSKCKNLDKQHEVTENSVAQQEFVNRQLVVQHKKKLENIRLTKIKNDIYKAKIQEEESEIESLNKMKEISNNLKPPSNDEIDPEMIEKCLSLVSTLASGAKKKEVWDQINNIVRFVRIPVLWNLLLKTRVAVNDDILCKINDNIPQSSPSSIQTQAYGLAELWSKHIQIETSSLCYRTGNMTYFNQMMSLLETVDSMYEDQIPDFSEKLILITEMRELQLKQSNLKSEIEDLKNYTSREIEANENYLQLMDMHNNLNKQVKSNIQSLGKSLQILRRASSFIIETRTSLLKAVQKLQSIDSSHKWVDLKTELTMFHNNFDINSTRKISLKGDVNAYRHLTACINQASTTLIFPTIYNQHSPFPMIKPPVYYFMDCFNQMYKLRNHLEEQLNLSQEKCNSGFLQVDQRCNVPVATNSYVNSTMNSLMAITATCDLTSENIRGNHDIIDQWVNQTVEKAVLALDDYKVYGASLEEWKQRFMMLIFMIKQSSLKFN